MTDLIRLPNARSVVLHIADCLDVMQTLPAETFQCCITSPPYFGLRDYQVDGQIGLEASPQDYVEQLVLVFREVRRLLRDDGTLWLNLGDSYARSGGSDQTISSTALVGSTRNSIIQRGDRRQRVPNGLKSKDLIGVPWLVAFALRDDGWFLRSDIIWHKGNPVPESTTDRPTSAHEHVFLLAKSSKYYYDGDSIKEASQAGSSYEDRHARNVWQINTRPFREAHFATMAPELAERCILAGCPAGGAVLDPFGGAGTTGLVAADLGRRATLIELNPDYAAIARTRLGDYVAPSAT